MHYLLKWKQEEKEKSVCRRSQSMIYTHRKDMDSEV